MKISIRNSRLDEYKDIESIMKQVQQMHIDWRPDIYKYSGTVLPLEVYEQAVEAGTFFVAEYEGHVAGILFIAYHHIENPNQVTRNIIYVDSMAIDEKY
ncbi:MAG: GNAT family N-acetyltransferase, partial [Lachnospiraceae bacterium]|nr:GNAT family N-acetyltransferase [Lachnospiraceae bacterium]